MARLSPTCLRGLGASNGRQDHTVLPYAIASFVLRTGCSLTETALRTNLRAQRCRVHHTASRVRHDRDTPLLGDEMARAGSADLPDGESEIFLREGLDDPNHFEISAQIEVYAHRTFPRSNSAKIVRHCWIVFGAAWNWVALCGNSSESRLLSAWRWRLAGHCNSSCHRRQRIDGS